MHVWWHFQCDKGHCWELFRDEDEDEEERGADSVCEFGHEAVTLTKYRPSDYVRIGLLPASRQRAKGPGKEIKTSQFFLEISEWDGSSRRISVEHYSWSDAIRRMELFRGLGATQAAERWERHGLGNQLDANYRRELGTGG